MSRIVDDLLDISRITRRKINLQWAKVEVATVLDAAVETSSPLIESRRQKLHIALAKEPLVIDADVTRLGQVVTNLLNNAAKFTPEGGEIWLGLKRQGSQAVITVRDNGMGMPPEMLPTIFDLFMQADGSIDRSQGGLGIGLTLVRSLVEMHRGTVQVSSDGLGKGTRFDVWLPLVREFRQSRDGQATDRPSQLALASSVIRRKILVVDDNVDAATTLAMMLSALGHESIAAHDGQTAINMAESFRPELVLLDIGLPGMNGYMVAEQMRQMPAVQDAILAALTGYGEDQDRRRAKESGFDEHFVKPISLDALQQLIDALPANRV
jgi:CheY-like chemotaxis protein